MRWAEFRRAKIGDYRHVVLKDFDWVWEKGQSWAIVGPNGSGKSSIAEALFDRWSILSGFGEISPDFPRSLDAWIGFERQRLLLERERKIDDTDLSELPDPGTLVEDFVSDESALERFALTEKRRRGLKQLSTGELRRACWARAVAANVPVLILDEPYEGLDVESVAEFRRCVDEAISKGTDVLFLTRREDDVPTSIVRRIDLEDGRIVGRSRSLSRRPSRISFRSPEVPGEPIVEMNRVDAGYPGVAVLRQFSWTVRRGERWLVRGPNGSGKSTLLSLIAGDHPHAFSQDVRLFSKRRGPDLTLEDLRSRIAFLSYSVHLQFRRLFDVSALEVVVSGFPRTIGLYRDPAWNEVEAARAAMRSLEIASWEKARWDEMSWGAQRSVLLARALVARPSLVMLDEPCQGLDAHHQNPFLDRVAQAIDETGAALIYVTHRGEEIDPKGFRVLELGQVVDR